MSTRSCIAERIGDGWKGVYHHSDGYPTGLGCYLFRCIHYEFRGDTKAFLDFAIRKHDGGWSHIYPSEYKPDGFGKLKKPVRRCYCHGYFAKRDGTKPGQGRGIIKGCECSVKPYKIGDRDEDNPSCDPLFIEWVYVFDPNYKTMAILEHFSEHAMDYCKGDLGGRDHLNCPYFYRHRLNTVVKLEEIEPDWVQIEVKSSLLSKDKKQIKWAEDRLAKEKGSFVDSYFQPIL